MSHLFSCADCNKQISTSAKKCPGCSREIQLTDINFKEMNLTQKAQIILTLSVLLFVAYLIVKPSPHIKNITAINAEKQSKIVEYFKSDKEPSILDAVWFDANTLALGVVNDGSKRTGFAMYACAVLKGIEYPINQTIVQIIDIQELVKHDKWKTLGMYNCSKIKHPT